MENNQLLPFERNRYYVGKLLTSSDFLAEQVYMNNKRRFINSMMFGDGVVCGLGVYNLDDLSIIIESGVAMDGLGREIVLENSVMRKLSAIEGFDSITGDRARLMLRYVEEPVHPVYSIARQERVDEEYELNRIREGWTLFLEEPPEVEPDIATEFLNTASLYTDDDYEILISIPGNVSCSARVKVSLVIKKLTDAQGSLSMDCTVQTPAFTNEDDGHELVIRLEDILLEKGDEVCRDYWLTAQGKPAPESLIVAKSNFIRISIDGQSKRPEENLLLKVNVVDISVYELIEREVGRISLESRQLAGMGDAVCLAELTLQRSKNDYIVEKIEDFGVKRYIHTMASEKLRQDYSGYFGNGQSAARPLSAGIAPESVEGVAAREPLYATGVCEIPLGTDTRKNDIVYSDEIMHGLGKGNIFVSVGFEYLAEESRTGETTKHTIYGDAELFAKDEPPISYAQTAVKVYDDRGSFVVAAKLIKPTNYVVLVIRWVAVKLPSNDDKALLHKMMGKSIAALTPTAVLGTRENHYFAVRFKNMEPCTLTYELTEKDSGEIASDGIYTAPAKEGVYEIRISCADMPLISTYAYAVVKKKIAEEPPAN